MEKKIIYFSGLNGIRAIAAIFVLITHTIEFFPKFGLQVDGNLPGGLAVTIFFSLSGFLISFLLLKEYDKQGYIDIKKFYLRRILRIWPLYYLWLFLSIIVIFICHLKFDGTTFLFYLFFGANIPFILHKQLPLIGHYWSLGVEEQFYLILPWLIPHINRIKRLIFIFVIFTILIKIYLSLFFYDTLPFRILDIARVDCMVIGGSIAYAYYKNHSIINTINSREIQFISWAVLFFLLSIKILTPFKLKSILIHHEITALLTAFIIIGQIKKTNKIFNLENKIFDYLGKISYGIYVIHPLMLFITSKLLVKLVFNRHVLPTGIKCFLFSIIVFLLTFLFSSFSYLYLEKYFLKFKNKYVVVQSQSTMS